MVRRSKISKPKKKFFWLNFLNLTRRILLTKFTHRSDILYFQYFLRWSKYYTKWIFTSQKSTNNCKTKNFCSAKILMNRVTNKRILTLKVISKLVWIKILKIYLIWISETNMMETKRGQLIKNYHNSKSNPLLFIQKMS